MAEFTGAKESPRPGVILNTDDYAYALIPFYFLKSWNEKTNTDPREWVRERRDRGKNFVLGMNLLRFALVGVCAYAFANKTCGKHPLFEFVLRSCCPVERPPV
jgi:hypothetical protein